MIPSASSPASSTVRDVTAAPGPASYRRDVAPQRRRRILHVDPERLVDRRMTDAEPQNEASARGVGDEGRALRACVGMPQVDVRDPRSHGDPPGRRPHELGGRHDVVVDLGGEDRVEPRFLGLARDRLHLAGAPARPRDNGQCESFCHFPPPSLPSFGFLRLPTRPERVAEAVKLAQAARDVNRVDEHECV